MTNFSDMLSKAKAMQEKMKEAQDQIKKIEVEGVSGGNLVKLTKYIIQHHSISIIRMKLFLSKNIIFPYTMISM